MNPHLHLGARTTSGCRLGIVAPEFPPDLGGMAELARGLATSLATWDDVTVYTAVGGGDRAVPLAQRAVLTGDPMRDAATLAAERVDAWLVLNAGFMPLASMLGRPVFAYLHGNDFLDPWIPRGATLLERVGWMPGALKLARARRRRAIAAHAANARHVFVNSTRTGALAADALGIPRERMSVCPPGVADVFFQERSGGAHDPCLRVLTVARLGRWVRRKNVDGVLHAVAMLRPRLRVAYSIVGDGDDRPRLEALAHKLGIADSVRFLGSVPHDRLLACYREADLFVLASRATAIDVEGFGIVYIEASGAGLPVMCSRNGGATDAVQDGLNGIVLPGSAAEDIAAGILRFASARDRFPAEQVRGFAERYRWSRMAAELRHRLVSHL